MNREDVDKCTILKVISGSQAYGTNTPESDTDMRGICVPPKKYFLTFDHRFEQFEDKVNDITIFNIQKYFQLAADNNPNILEILWIDNPKHILIKDKIGDRLREIRSEFLSTKAKWTYSGYAYAQLKRIETHRKWLLSPPDHKPTPDETDHKNKLKQWHQYEEWKKNRNAKRAALEAKYGYDCKHAMHLVRLMRQGLEILTTGQLNVFRLDAAELLEIRNGGWSYEKLKDYAAEMDEKMKYLYEHPEACAVPHKPDRNKLNEYCMEVLEDYWRDHESV